MSKLLFALVGLCLFNICCFLLYRTGQLQPPVDSFEDDGWGENFKSKIVVKSACKLAKKPL